MSVTKIETSALSVLCPVCQAGPGAQCIRKGSAEKRGGDPAKVVTLMHPHSERVKVAGDQLGAAAQKVVDGITPADTEAAIIEALQGDPTALKAIADVVDPQIGQDTSSTDAAKGNGKAKGGKAKAGKDLPGRSPAEPQATSCSACGWVFGKARDHGKCNTKTACDKRVGENEALKITPAKRVKQGGKLTDEQKAKLVKIAAKAPAA
jgi:rubredoxin